MAAQKKTLKLKRPDATPAASAPVAAGAQPTAVFATANTTQQKKPHYATFSILTIFACLFMIALLVTQWMEWDFFNQADAALYVPQTHYLPFELSQNGAVGIPGWMVEWKLTRPTYGVLKLLDKMEMTGIYIALGVLGFLVIEFILCCWLLFRKAGRAGWPAIIPIAHLILFIKRADKSAWWFALLFVPFVNIFIYIDLMIGISKQYRRGAGFAAGMVFLPFIMLPVLAFGNTTHVDYEPPKPEPKETEDEGKEDSDGGEADAEGEAKPEKAKEDAPKTARTLKASKTTRPSKTGRTIKTVRASKIKTVKKPPAKPQGDSPEEKSE